MASAGSGGFSPPRGDPLRPEPETGRTPTTGPWLPRRVLPPRMTRTERAATDLAQNKPSAHAAMRLRIRAAVRRNGAWQGRSLQTDR